jgi:tetratricopeptide (TPR) repeat protein
MARVTQRLGMARFEADEYYRQALDAYRKNRFDNAINSLNDAILIQGNRAEFFAARGLIYLEDGVKDKAQADFEKALKLNKHEMLAHYGRGIIAYQSNNWDEALAHFSDAYKADPERPETLYYLALVYHRKHQHDVAHRLMEVGLGFLPEEDKRRPDFQRWLREFEKIIRDKQAPRLNVMGRTDE